jgi:UDP-N-acetylmuramate dehydrogenase
MHNKRHTDKHLRDEQRIISVLNALDESLQRRIERDVPLCCLTTLQIGGPALALCRIQNIDQARRFHEISREHDIPGFCLGGGSNVLVDDLGFQGLVMRMEITDLGIDGETVSIGAGATFDSLIQETLQAGLTGLEFASGIPGTIGGAITGNAGCFGHDISEFLLEATLLDTQGRVETVGAADLGFAYRTSKLKTSGDILLSAVFRLQRGNLDQAAETRRENIALRRRKHPHETPTAGSYFKNLPPEHPGGRRRAAGQLLEQAGAGNLSSGGAAVFDKHANIIINRDQATCSDVLDLAAKMKDAVHGKFGVVLEEEVRHIRHQQLK